MPEDKQENTFPCQECQAGIMRLKYITYFTWLDDDLVTVPDFPAWVCDMCARREYDSRAVSWLNILLNAGPNRTSSRNEHKRGRSVRRPPAQPPSSIDQ